MYKISELILRYTSRSKEDKLNIVKKLGYKNINRGLRRLDTLIQTGQCPDSLRKKLPTALGLDPSVIQKAYEQTLNQLRERWSHKFGQGVKLLIMTKGGSCI